MSQETENRNPTRVTKAVFEDADYQQFEAWSSLSNPSPEYRLTLVQQPSTGKAVSSHLRARGMKWPIEPPPVLELSSNEKEAHKWLYIHNPNWFCIANLEPIEVKKTKSPKEKDNKDGIKDNLSGLLASSLHKVKNPEDRNEHGYFVFGDLNVRDAGRYKLRFTLFEMRRYDEHVYAARIHSVLSEEFLIQAQKANIPTKDSTKLSKTLSEAGVKIRLRKESTKRKPANTNWSATTSENLAYSAARAPAVLAPLLNHTPHTPSSNPSARSSRNNGEDVSHRMSVVHGDMHAPGHIQTQTTSPVEGQTYRSNHLGYVPPTGMPGPPFDYQLAQPFPNPPRIPTSFPTQREPSNYQNPSVYQPMQATMNPQPIPGPQATPQLQPQNYQQIQPSSSTQPYQPMQQLTHAETQPWNLGGPGPSFRQEPSQEQDHSQTYYNQQDPQWEMQPGWSRREGPREHHRYT